MTHSKILLLAACVAAATARADEPYRRVLTDTAAGVWEEDFALAAPELPGTGGVPWSIRKETLRGGLQDGVDLITIDNGRLRIRVIPTRGLSILDVRQGDFRLGWNSPVQELVHPRHIDLESRNGLGWLQGFNEWMVRCGLEFAGHPGRDELADDDGNVSSLPLTLHGRIGNLPASRVEVLVDRDPPHRLRVRGTVHERWFNGPKLELQTELSTVPGSDTLRIEDAVTNHASAAQEFQLIYHANYGSPLLGAGAKVVAPLETVAPMTEHAGEALDTYDTYAAPRAGFVEEVFLCTPYADAAGRSMVMLRNAAGDRGASIRWSVKELPCLTIWKNTAAEADGYVTGLEPATGFPYNRRVERLAGRVPKLAPGETRRFTLDFGLHADREGVDAQAAAIADIQAGRPTKRSRELPRPVIPAP